MFRFQASLIATSIVLIVLGAAGLDIVIDYRETKLRQRSTASDITGIVENHVFESVAQVSTLLDELAGELAGQSNHGLSGARDLERRLKAYCRTVIGCHAMGVINPEGRVVTNSIGPAGNVDVSQRAYFREAQKPETLFIGPAIVTRLPGQPVLFHISRPVFSQSGKLLAVVMAGMNTDHFTAFYSLMNGSLNPTVSVFKDSGELVARFPDMKAHVGSNIAQSPLMQSYVRQAMKGTFEQASPLDGKTYISAYRAIPELGLVVFAGIERQLAMKLWKERALRTGSIVAVLLATILIILFFGYRAVTRQAILEARNRELDRLSNIDGLTGIGNRRLVDASLIREWARHRRQHCPLSVILLDVDCFKAYNDRYGHQAGDECLQQVAMALTACLQRGTDLVARYGGEEFIAILEADAEGAMNVGQRMRHVIQSLRIPHEGSSISKVVTASLGVASTSTQQAGSAEALVERADKALYQAKALGRNRVVLAEPAEASEAQLQSGRSMA